MLDVLLLVAETFLPKPAGENVICIFLKRLLDYGEIDMVRIMIDEQMLL
jgi:hypothetical protein